ncbi:MULTISPECIES: response regulator [Spirulina sp. CCY15215]|uniref:sensor histidine kinase n=1 Tax=Spirulina sp. CCY15215 TaxID=2767591 RepID=UPI00194E17E5|nr:response regulator [Spirulina major]
MTDSDQADILIVDDTPDNIRLLSTMLSKRGYRVRPAINGKMAILAAKALEPDLILLDINMPEMNGYEVCQHLKANEKTKAIPVIFLSALDHVEDKVKAFEVGGIDYITKPFQFAEVLVRIENQLTIRKLQKTLQKQNNRLKQVMTQLVQNEKMAGLGQLVAGIAHEINNPISFIYGNLKPASEYIQDICDLLELYQQEYPQPKENIQETIEEMDLDFIKADLQNSIASMQTGAERIRTIILNLRNFARLDEAQVKLANLHEGLDSTLSILQHRLKSRDDRQEIFVKQNYGNIPKVTCYPGQLNQVFFHLLNNAIDAFDEWESENPQITISTDIIDGDRVGVRITDNGKGIAQDLQTRLFDPFFTTKSVGKGVGLGLAISYQIIVEQHSGQIVCESSPETGTKFSLEIPLASALAAEYR